MNSTTLVLCLVPLLAVLAGRSCAQGQPDASSSPTIDSRSAQPGQKSPQNKDEVRGFAPGVSINWKDRAVEVEASVVLREGPLELLACSPGTREHESILVARARPLHVFQAMGLVGIEPGSPMRNDPATGRARPPSGQALEVVVRYPVAGKWKSMRAEEWLIVNDTGKPPERIDWVFAGSYLRPDGTFAADDEGTVVCVVDFETALIAPAALHTSANELLWLSPNTAAIPPLGSSCSLIIHAKANRRLDVILSMGKDGKLRRAGALVSAADVLRMLHAEHPAISSVAIVLEVEGGIPEEVISAALESLAGAGVGRELIEVRRSEKPSESSDDGG